MADTRSEKIVMRYSDYLRMVDAAKEIDRRTDDVTIKEKKKKFISRHEIPTIEDLLAHSVPENLETFLPYLVYYREPGICRIDPKDPDAEGKAERLKQLRRYLTRLFDEMIDFEYDVDDEEEGEGCEEAAGPGETIH